MDTARPQFTRCQPCRHTVLYRMSAPLVLFTIVLLGTACSGGAPAVSDSDTPSPTSQPLDTPPKSEVDETEQGPKQAPDFELALFANDDHEAGETIMLSDFAGQPVVLNFWFPSCPPCVAEMPEFEEAYQQFKGDGVEFIGVQLLGLDTSEDGQAFVERLNVNYALGPDETADSSSEIVKNYGVSGFPTTVFIDRDGNISRTWSGPLNLEKLQELIREIL